MSENIPLEFENIGEYHRAVLQQLIDNNALLRVMLDYEVEKHAYRIASENGFEEISKEDMELKKREIVKQMNEKIREYKLHALAEINLRK
jgi:Glu-tRNA(Gln) amidotransferase subunit E-like FAD-binding protein